MSFMLCLNSARDVEKLQKLQNRCLRSCFNIFNPVDIGTQRLHHEARVNTLRLRRDVQLLNIMFLLKINNKFKKESVRITRNAERYVFNTEIVHKDIYAKSPFYCGVSLWNSIPIEYQNLIERRTFKTSIKKHLNIF